MHARRHRSENLPATIPGTNLAGVSSRADPEHSGAWVTRPRVWRLEIVARFTVRVPRPGHGLPKTGIELKHGPSLCSSILQFHSIHFRLGTKRRDAHALCCPNYADAVVDRKSYGSTLKRE